MRTRTFSTLDAAYAAGVRYVDAARSYGRAEEFLAGWLAQSRALLGDRLSLYQVHSLTLDSGLFPDAALLSRLRAEGVSIGLTTSGRIRQKRSAGPCR